MKDPVPHWTDERVSEGAARFAKHHAPLVGSRGPVNHLQLLADAFDAGRRYEQQQQGQEALDKLRGLGFEVDESDPTKVVLKRPKEKTGG